MEQYLKSWIRTMQLGELLDELRKQYIDRFIAMVARLHEQADDRALTEVALRDDKGQVVKEGELMVPLRLDAVLLRGGSPVQKFSIDSDALLSFDPIVFTWGQDLDVTLLPFSWDSLDIRLPVRPRTQSYQTLVAWFMKWFREEEDGDGKPLGIVHFLSDPTHSPEGVTFQADLGTAPVECLGDLLDAIAALGVPAVVLGQRAIADGVDG